VKPTPPKPQIGAFRFGDFDAPNKLAIGICTLGAIRIETSIMMKATGMPLGQACLNIGIIGYGIQDARNIAWNTAENQGWEYFMFWDDDVVPLTGGYVETMLETMDQNPEIDILGGVYPARQNIPSPIVTLEAGGKPWWGWEDGGIHKVWMTGTGFTMYRMESIKKLPAPVKTYKLKDHEGNPKDWEVREFFRLEGGTDDYVLAKDAEAAGLSWYVHGGIICDQIELSGHRFEIKNARQRIKGKEVKKIAEDQDTAANYDGEPGRRLARRWNW
jgi:hypothetical protein